MLVSFPSKLKQHLLDWIYPTTCGSCQKVLSGEIPLCESCSRKLEWIVDCCQQCGNWREGSYSYCSHCKDLSFGFTFASSALRKTGIAQETLYALKYAKSYHFLPLVTSWLKQTMEDLRVQKIGDAIIVPVPMHPLKRLRRGFDLVTELSKLLSHQTNYPCKLLLKRKKNSLSQTQLSKSARRRNLSQAFGSRSFHPKNNLKNTTVLLIDDVFTTGSTAQACTKVLKKTFEVQKVVVLSVLRS